jgi:hypothetical protein
MQRKIYLPGNINTTQATTTFNDVVGIPPNGNIDLDRWIQFQLDNGYILAGGSGSFTTVSMTIGATTYPIGTPVQTILTALNTVSSPTTSTVLTTAAITVGATVFAIGSTTQSILAALANTMNKTTTAMTIGSTTYPIGTTVQTILDALQADK